MIISIYLFVCWLVKSTFFFFIRKVSLSFARHKKKRACLVRYVFLYVSQCLFFYANRNFRKLSWKNWRLWPIIMSWSLFNYIYIYIYMSISRVFLKQFLYFHVCIVYADFLSFINELLCMWVLSELSLIIYQKHIW